MQPLAGITVVTLEHAIAVKLVGTSLLELAA